MRAAMVTSAAADALAFMGRAPVRPAAGHLEPGGERDRSKEREGEGEAK